MRLSTLFGISVITLVASFATANAQQRQARVGVLECEGGQNVGFVVGSAAELECVFHNNDGRPYPYIASIHRFGVDLGFTQQTHLAWAVNAPTAVIGPGDLAGSYGGVGANASVGFGAGGNFLIGGSANSFALQPLSVQGQTGLNVTAGIADLQLRAVNLRSGPRRYHRGHRGHRQHRRHR